VAGYIIRRCLQSLLVLVAVTVLIFGILKLAPGNAAQVMAGLSATPEDLAAIEHRMGLDRPVHVQYWKFITGLFSGTLKPATFPDSMIGLVGRKLLASVELGFVAIVAAVLLSIPAGIIAAVYRNTVWDYGISVLSLAGISIPVFWIALMLMVVFGGWLKWLPISGRGDLRFGLSILTADGWRHILIPAMSLTLIQMAMNARLTRSCLLEVLQLDYIKTARSKGLREIVVILKHAFRNALLPVVTNVGLTAGMVFAGAILTETVTAWPGIGRLVYQAIVQRDEPLLFGLTVIIALFYQVTYLGVDLLYGYLNPTIVYD